MNEISIAHADEKILKPNDKAIIGGAGVSPEEIGKHYAKPIRGFAKLSVDGVEVDETPNLVLLGGREFLAQKLADIYSSSLLPESSYDLSKFKIRYFGVGEGGADASEGISKIGPFDNDLDLVAQRKIGDVSNTNNYKYIKDGNLKNILSDGGKIEIVKEGHTVNVQGEEVQVDAMTTIKYTMYITKDELFKESNNNELGPMYFNEAVLYAVDFEGDIPATFEEGDDNSRFSAKNRAFARFTTTTKILDVKDSLKIEWYILV